MEGKKNFPCKRVDQALRKYSILIMGIEGTKARGSSSNKLLMQPLPGH